MNKKSLLSILVGGILVGLPLAVVTKQGVLSWQKPQKDLGLDVSGISETQPMAQRPLPQDELYKRTREITVQVRSGDGQEQLGSGIIIDFEDNRYMVLTNEHVVKNHDSYSIRTYRGKNYPARLTENNNIFGRNDLAILEFTKRVKGYQRATIGAFNEVAKEDYVYAAGYPANAAPNDNGGFILYPGRVLFRLPRPLKDGYEVGLSNDLEKGMSGGPLVNNKGEVVGINGRHRALWSACTSYEYEDETSACDDMTVEPSSWIIPIETYMLAQRPQPPAQRPQPPAQRPPQSVDRELGERDSDGTGPNQRQQDRVDRELGEGDSDGTGPNQPDYFKLANNAELLATDQWKRAKSLDDWREVENSWENAINILKEVPRNHPRREDAKTRIKEYGGIVKYVRDMVENIRRSQQPQPDPYWAALQEGRTASDMLVAKTMGNSSPSVEDWEEIAARWRQGLDFLKKVSFNHPEYKEVRDKKITEYQGKLDRVELQLSKARQRQN